MDKKLKKAWSMLDYRKYHLNFESNGEKESWKLFEKYDGWMKDGSKPIMTSEEYTSDDLLKFAKKNKEYTCSDFNTMLMIIPMIMIVLMWVNVYFVSKYLTMFIGGLATSTIIIDIVSMIIIHKNNKVLNYDWRRQRKRFINSLEKYKEE